MNARHTMEELAVVVARTKRRHVLGMVEFYNIIYVGPSKNIENSSCLICHIAD